MTLLIVALSVVGAVLGMAVFVFFAFRVWERGKNDDE